jgi:hypothetical protein
MDKETWIIILVVFLYLLQAVAGGLIARNRCKSFWIWFGVCIMMIFPIGFIAMLLYTSDDNPMTP